MTASQHQVDILVDSAFVHRVDVDALERCVRATLGSRRLRIARVVSVRVTDSRTVRRLNRRFRGEDSATDVLSFNTDFDGLRRPDGAAELGEIVIALPVAARGARERGRTLAEELALLVVHGTLHLLGFDHEQPDEDARMKQMELVALGRAGLASAART
ncbi:MAG: rRNA maturation RNase YbeY [Chloroflexi bacterium]|nr:rRNA maturation RNase YbeY [Chloroflexota bacterium]MCY3588773.1 rRNA maturation RNase YbeY [Chloroflexota bacterium]MCY3686493.1 rRNA maturation RNase YbeY [Chloroflexota bacterium]MDE2708217.1 rRNA maturation RNase YbeY [Chloroflexota bacterium]